MRLARVILILVLGWLSLIVSKDMMLEVLNNCLSYNDAGLLSGIILGDKSGLSKDFQKILINSGLIHLVVVSGSNVMLLIGGVIENLASWLGRKWAIIWGLILGWKYVILVGWEVPVLRAMLLLSIMYWAQLLGRKYNLSRGLGLAIVIMVVGEPRVVVSVSFWLSITAFLGVLSAKKILVEAGQSTYKKNRKIGRYLSGLRQILGETVWIMIWITPILALVFGKISLLSPLTNVLVLGLVGMVSVAGTVGIILGLWWLTLGKAILWLTIPSLTYLRKVAEFGGGDVGLQVEFNWWILVGYYLILFYWLMKNKNSS